MKSASKNAMTGLAALAAAGCTSLSTVPPAGQPAAVPAPSASPGTVWSYRDVSTYRKGNVMGEARWQIGAADAKRLTALPGTSGSLGSLAFTRDWALEKGELPNIGPVSFSPPFPVLQFPLEVGKRWSLYTAATGGDSPYQVQVTATVDGWERISVPAGEFDAIRVSILANPQDAKPWRTSTRITQYWWYAPAVNGVVRRVEESEWTVTGKDSYVQEGDHNRMDLIEYRPGP